MKKYSSLIVILFCGFLITNAQSEKLYFDVIHSGKPLGTLEAEKFTNGDKTIFKSHTYIEYHLFATISIIYDYEVVYKDELLDEAKVHITVRGHEKTNVKTVKEESLYKFYSDNEFVKELNRPIKQSIERLFFEEPIGVDKVFAEEHGEYHKLEKIKEHTYKKTAPNGHENIYYYENGKLIKSEVDAGVIEFSIVLKK